MLSVAHTALCSDLVYAFEQDFRPLASYVLKIVLQQVIAAYLATLWYANGTPSKWHAQALMLSRALPADVVLGIGEHDCEQADVLVEKRGAWCCCLS